MLQTTDNRKRKGIILGAETLAYSLALPAIAAVLSVFLVFRTVAHRIGWEQLPVPLLIAVIWSLLLWCVLYYTPYIKRLTRKEAGLAGAVLTLITMLWMLFPSSLIASCVAWIAFVLVTMSRPSWQLWMIRAGGTWLCLALVVAVAWSGIISLSRLGGENLDVVVGAPARADLPDIYFIVPDRFTSIDGLREFEDNPDEFVEQLREYGFYVRDDAMSHDPASPTTDPTNTTRTLRYFASAFNDGATVDYNITYNEANRLLKNSSTVRRLQALGYTYYNIGSWFSETRNSLQADYNYSYRAYDLISLVYGSELSTAVIDMSVLRDLDAGRLFTLSGGSDTRRSEHLYQKGKILEIASSRTDSPKFVLAHLILPHPPYVWGGSGANMPSGLSARGQYLQQVEFTKGFLLDIVDGLGGGIVIIQSDEGVLFAAPSDNEGLVETQWNGVLTAWRIPGVDAGELDKVSHIQVLGFVTDFVEQEASSK